MFGAVVYDATDGKSFTQSLMGRSTTPQTIKQDIGQGKVRETVISRGVPEQLIAQGGITPVQVNMADLLKNGLPLGLPKDAK